MWDPGAYLRFADERSRPFTDLLARVPVTTPQTVVDLGCGPGHLTLLLHQRWPAATVLGLDSSPEMIAAAQALPADPAVRFEVADVRDWHATAAVGVVVANAVLQWVPGHRDLLTRWAGELAGGATLAFHVPGNFEAASHGAIREVAALPRWRDRLAGSLSRDAVLTPEQYAQLLTARGLTVDAWETTYLHRLAGAGDDHPVLRWVEGTALRSVRSSLDDGDWAAFRAELKPRLAAAYPVHNGWVWFPFRRIFVVATAPA